MKRRLPALMSLLLLTGCRITPDMSGCEKAALGSLYVLAIVALTALVVGIFAMAAVRGA